MSEGSPNSTSSPKSPEPAEGLQRSPTLVPANCAPELTPAEPLRISARMRQLMGPPPFRDPSSQVDLNGLLGVLAKELGVESLLQLMLVERLAVLIIEGRQLQSSVQTAIALKRPSAAREILLPNFNHFYPTGPMVIETNGEVSTAFGSFMDTGGRDLAWQPDDQVIADALATLAVQGMGEAELDHQAYVLALPTIERLERILATKRAEGEALLEQILRLKDRRARISAHAAALGVQ